MSKADIDTHGFIMPNGRHKGELITRMPISYLKWMVNERHNCAAYAEAELKRRGTVTGDLDISGHALDQASLRLLVCWQKTRDVDEGLHAWLLKRAAIALAEGERKDGGKIIHDTIQFVFEMDGVWPVLKTVMSKHKKGNADAK